MARTKCPVITFIHWWSYELDIIQSWSVWFTLWGGFLYAGFLYNINFSTGNNVRVQHRRCFTFHFRGCFWNMLYYLVRRDAVQPFCEISWGRLLIKGPRAAAEAVAVCWIQCCSQVACRYGRLYPFWVAHGPLNRRICTRETQIQSLKHESWGSSAFIFFYFWFYSGPL